MTDDLPYTRKIVERIIFTAKPEDSGERPHRETGGRLIRNFGSGLLALSLFVLVFALRVDAQLGANQSNGPLYSPRPELGRTSNGLPPALKDVGIEQHLNQQIPLDLQFNDESGKPVKLSEFFHDKPVVLVFAYYNCPMLCTQVLNGLVGAMKGISFDAGREYEVLTISFDPREKSDLASAKKQFYIADYPRPTAPEGWRFLTGDEDSIRKLADAAGFKYKFDAATNQYAHASGIMVLTPQGKLSRYFYGIEYAPKDLRLALVDASQNKIGSPVDQLLLFYYHYDPATGKYGLVIMNVVRLAGIATVFSMIALIFVLRKRGLKGSSFGAGGTA